MSALHVTDDITHVPGYTQTLEEIQNLAVLEPDWNDEGAPAINPVCIQRAQTLLHKIGCGILAQERTWPTPSVFPTIQGGVHLYWASEAGQQFLLTISPGEDDTVSYQTKRLGEPSVSGTLTTAQAVEKVIQILEDA